MVTSELKDGIVWLKVVGKLTFQEAIQEVSKWLPQKDTFSGFITDVRKLTGVPSALEKHQLETWRQQNKSGKPHAILGKDNVMSLIVKLYIRSTRAKDTRYFTDAQKAINWIKNFDQREQKVDDMAQ
jgi:hypothetical protein